MAGRLHAQKRKKLTKSRVVVPEDAGRELGTLLYFVQIDDIIRVTHSPVHYMSAKSGPR